MLRRGGETAESLSLSELRGRRVERAQVRGEIEIAKSMLIAGGERSVEARLPTIVGWLPDSERAALSQYQPNRVWPLSPTRLEPDHSKPRPYTLDDYSEFQLRFPTLCKIVAKDMRMLGVTQDMDIRVERHFVYEGNQPIPGPDTAPGGGAHIDYGFVHDPGDQPKDIMAILALSYLVADKYPTEFYAGNAHFSTSNEFRFRELSVTQLDSGLFIPAPEGAVVRVAPLTVHRSPIMPQDDTRTLTEIYGGLAVPITQAA